MSDRSNLLIKTSNCNFGSNKRYHKFMSTTATLVSLNDYLSNNYNPDMEFRAGELIRRNVGTQQHGSLQFFIGEFFQAKSQEFRIKQFVEVRLRLSAATGRHVVPDVMVVEVRT